MEKFVKGEVVIVPFPFSDLTNFKKRPALVISSLHGEDLILCQITSQNIKDQHAIKISDNDFISGKLNLVSNIRPNKIFTADKKLVLYTVGKLQDKKIHEIIENLISIIKN